VTIDELIVSFGFDSKKALEAIDKTEKKLNEFIDNAKDIDISVNTGVASAKVDKLNDTILKVVSYAGKASRALEKIGRSAAVGIGKAIKLSANLASSLAKIGAGAIAGAIAGSGAIASNVSEKAKLAESFGTDYKTVQAIAKGLKDIKVDNVIDIFEEMKNKVGLSISSLERDLKSGKAAIEEFNLSGYTDAKGKKKDAKRIEEGTLNDLFATTLGNGDLAKVDSDFKGVMNTAIALQKFSKKSANEQFMIMAKLVDISEKYTSSMDDWLGGESQKLFSQLRAEAKKTGRTIEEVIRANRAKQFISKDDVESLKRYDESIRNLGSTISEVFKKSSAGIGEVLTPYINRITDYLQAHKKQISEFIDFASQKVSAFFQKVEEWGKTNLFDNGKFVGYEEALTRIIDKVRQKLSELKKSLVNALGGQEFIGKLNEIIGYIKIFAGVIGGAMVLNAIASFSTALMALGVAGSPIFMVIAAITALIALFANWDTVSQWGEGVKNAISNAMTSAKDSVYGAVDAMKAKLQELWAALKNSTLGKGIGDLWKRTKDAFSGAPAQGSQTSSNTPQTPAPAPVFSTPSLPAKAPVGTVAPVSVHNNNNTNVTVNVQGTNASASEIGRAVGDAIEADSMKRNMTTVQKIPNAG